MTARTSAAVLLTTLLATLVLACGGASSSPSAGTGAIPVVATTTIHADIVARVGGNRVAVTSIVPKGGEVHTFDPSPRDVGRVEEARLVVANGLGLDDWLTQLARDSGTGAPIVALSDALPSSELILEDGVPNPHAWLNPTLAAAYGRTVAGALGRIDPANASEYAANGEKFATELVALRDELQARFDRVPPANRKVVSFHDALPYFARAFDLEIVGVIVSAPGQDPSAGELAALIDAIRASGVRAILSEVQFSDELARTIAADTGATVVSDLYTDTLGDPPVDTYAGMLRWDVDRIVGALQ
ncbi:MAG: metal ABC transporter substrate-binding protein [Chloroflexota bacterium]|nr:metal ABC transporter substrate-binding protein [Chloroflexota bacterium]